MYRSGWMRRKGHEAGSWRLLLMVTVSVGLLMPALGAAQIIKCRTPAGRIVYSDIPCEKQGAASLGAIDATPNEVGALKPPPLGAATTHSHTVQTTVTQTRAQSNPPPSSQDNEARDRRKNELALFLNGMASTPEQKQAAHHELSQMALLGVCRLTEEQRQRRDGAYTDLGSLVRSRRAPAFAVLFDVLASCQRG